MKYFHKTNLHSPSKYDKFVNFYDNYFKSHILFYIIKALILNSKKIVNYVFI